MIRRKGMLLISKEEEGTKEALKAKLEYDIKYLLSLTTAGRLNLLFGHSELMERRRFTKDGKRKDRKNNPAGSCSRRIRRRKIEPGVYRKIKSDKLLVIDNNNEYHVGHVCVRKKGRNRYEYTRWREGAKIKEKYLGAITSYRKNALNL